MTTCDSALAARQTVQMSYLPRYPRPLMSVRECPLVAVGHFKWSTWLWRSLLLRAPSPFEWPRSHAAPSRVRGWMCRQRP